MNRDLLESKIRERYSSNASFIKDLEMSQATFYRRLDKWDWTFNEVRRIKIMLGLSEQDMHDIF